MKQQLIGEAKFIRAFCYFYLVNLYGDVPLVTGTDYSVNSTLEKKPKAQVWQQIIKDLIDAKVQLSSMFLNSDALSITTERVRPTKWAAMALLARSYLYNEDWLNAQEEADSIINNSTMFGLPQLSGVFIKNSMEAIWQLQPVNTGWNTELARVFVLTGAPNSLRPVYLSTSLLSSFEAGDKRDSLWVNSIVSSGTTYYFPYKYKIITQNAPVTEYTTVFRLAELYLIRAETRARQNELTSGISDLDKIRGRAGLPLISVTNPNISQSALLAAIVHERQVELFTEWGHRWLDLKRLRQIDSVMNLVATQKGGKWNTVQQFYPIPLTDIQRDPNLIQNTGY